MYLWLISIKICFLNLTYFFNFFEYNLLNMNIVIVLLDVNLLSSLVVRKLEMIKNDSMKYKIFDFELCSQIEELNMQLKNKKVN